MNRRISASEIHLLNAAMTGGQNPTFLGRTLSKVT
jgi:hypothetical protein